MAVKRLQSAARVLATFEALAAHQPVGVGALSRVLQDDKSAVQRALMTLDEAGWIQRTADDRTLWELTPRVPRLTHGSQRRTSLVERARPTLEALRDEVGETTLLSIPRHGEVVVLEVVESKQLVRTAPTVGFQMPAETSAAGQAILAWLPPERLSEFLADPLSPRVTERLALVRARGWSVNDRDVSPAASAVAAPLLAADKRPVASIAISAPADRMPPSAFDRLGRLVAAAASRLSVLE